MNNQSFLLTNTLLAVIAALLLVQIFQKDSAPSSRGSRASENSTYISPAGSPSNAPDGTKTEVHSNSQAPAMEDFIFQALRAFPKGCDGKSVLADCNSAAAAAVKTKVQSWTATEMSPRELFDKIVATYGEQALTDEAQRIRAMRKK